MSRLCRILVFALLTQFVPGLAPAAISGTCALNITITFSSTGVSNTDASRTMSFGTTPLVGSPGHCYGTAVVPTTTGGMIGGPSTSSTMNCNKIVAGGLGNFGGVMYDGMTPTAGMQWAYAGTVGGGTFVIIPGADTVVGIATGVQVGTSLANCKLGSSIASVTLVGIMTFVRL